MRVNAYAVPGGAVWERSPQTTGRPVLTDARQLHGREAVRISWTLFCALLVLVLCVGCGVTRSQWSLQREVRAVDTMSDRGEYAEARARYIELASKAEAQVDLQYLQFRAAFMLEQMGDANGALEEYARIYTRPTHPYDDWAGRSMFRAGHVYEDLLHDPQTAQEVWAATVLAFPDSTFADDALLEIQRNAERTDTLPEFVDWMAEKYPQVQSREIADNFVYYSAKILDDEMDRCDDAMELYAVLQSHFARSSFVDDAVWRTALCHRRNGRIDDEYRVLHDSVMGREVSVLVGDYNYAHYNPAMRRIAEIHEERGEIDLAIHAWRRFQKVFLFSLDSDDVQFHLIELYEGLGKVDDMRRLAAELERNWPESRYVKPAWDRVEAAEAGR